MARTPQEVFASHAAALVAADLDGLVADHTDDAVYITPSGVHRGRDEIRDGYVALFADLPEAAYEVPVQVFEDDVAFLERTAVAEKARARDGADAIVFTGDGIRAHTVRSTLERTG